MGQKKELLRDITPSAELRELVAAIRRIPEPHSETDIYRIASAFEQFVEAKVRQAIQNFNRRGSTLV